MLNLTHLEFVKTNKIADLLFLLIDPQIRGRKFQQREIDLYQFTNEDRTRGHCCCDCPGPIPGPIVMRGVRFLAAEAQTLAQATMEDKNPWNGYGKPSFHILNLSNVQIPRLVHPSPLQTMLG